MIEINPEISQSNLLSLLLSTGPRSWLCLLPSAVDLTNCTLHMSIDPNICELSFKLITRGAADSLQMCGILWVGTLRVWWCLCLCNQFRCPFPPNRGCADMWHVQILDTLLLFLNLCHLCLLCFHGSMFICCIMLFMFYFNIEFGF